MYLQHTNIHDTLGGRGILHSLTWDEINAHISVDIIGLLCHLSVYGRLWLLKLVAWLEPISSWIYKWQETLNDRIRPERCLTPQSVSFIDMIGYNRSMIEIIGCGRPMADQPWRSCRGGKGSGGPCVMNSVRIRAETQLNTNTNTIR